LTVDLDQKSPQKIRNVSNTARDVTRRVLAEAVSDCRIVLDTIVVTQLVSQLVS
jgi:hypothetical protein